MLVLYDHLKTFPLFSSEQEQREFEAISHVRDSVQMVENAILERDQVRMKMTDCRRTAILLTNITSGSGQNPPPRGGGRGYSHMKQTGMLVVSFRGVDFGFWSHFGCSWESANIFGRQGLV